MSDLAEKLATAVAAETIILSPASPYKSAEKFLQVRYTGEDGITRLLQYRDGFYAWTGTHYRQISKEELRADVWRFLEAARVRIQATNEGHQDTTAPFNPNTTKVNQVLDAVQGQILLGSHLVAPTWRPGSLEECLWRATEMLACRNGLLHLPSRYLAEHTPELLTLNALDFDYDPQAAAPVGWLKFLNSLWPTDPESIFCLQEIFGYFLSGDLSQQKIFLLVGPKRGGKGTIAYILKLLIGPENVSGISLSQLNERFGAEPLIDKTAMISGDVRMGGGSDQHRVVQWLLSVSGEDHVSVERKYIGKHWEGKLPVRFLLLSNELPRLTDASATIASRFITLSLQESFFGREDQTLKARISTELPGILNWALDGLDRLTKRGHFVLPEASKAAADELEEISSPVLAFVHKRCEEGGDKAVPKDELFQAWSGWCSEHGHRPGSESTFSRNLHSLFPKVRTARPRTGGGRVWVHAGIGLKPWSR